MSAVIFWDSSSGFNGTLRVFSVLLFQVIICVSMTTVLPFLPGFSPFVSPLRTFADFNVPGGRCLVLWDLFWSGAEVHTVSSSVSLCFDTFVVKISLYLTCSSFLI